MLSAPRTLFILGAKAGIIQDTLTAAPLIRTPPAPLKKRAYPLAGHLIEVTAQSHPLAQDTQLRGRFCSNALGGRAVSLCQCGGRYLVLPFCCGAGLDIRADHVTLTEACWSDAEVNATAASQLGRRSCTRGYA